MSKGIRSIVIVGGGSAGWMSAAYLNRVLDAAETPINITVVESPDLGTIGVGEATIPTIRDFLALVGVPEIELIVKTNATIKAAIRFDSWLQHEHSYYHPFEAPDLSDGIDIASHWTAEALKGQSPGQFAEATGVLARLCDAHKVPKLFDSPEYDSPTAYAYHLDAILLGQYLRELCISRGVNHIEGTVNHVETDSSGNISRLITDSEDTIDGDFFIDCSGFRSLLIEKTLGADFSSYDDELLCNRAVAMPTPHPADHRLNACTIATAKEAGWMWQIDLATRRGNGYVYCDAFESSDDAESNLRRQIGQNANEVDARHLTMRVGRRNEFWVKNCLAVGLSGGFIEPLESTGLQLIEMGLRLFFDHLPGAGDVEPLRKRYNTLMSETYDEIKDFIVLHYALTKRQDTDFWRHCGQDLTLSPRLTDLLDLWKYKLPSSTDFPNHGVFGHINYAYILAGMDALVPGKNTYLASIQSQRSHQLLAEMRNIHEQALRISPTQSDYIKRIRAPFVN